MQIGNFDTLAKAKSALFVDETLLMCLCTENEWLLQRMYETLYIAPALYRYYTKNLDIETLKNLKKITKRTEVVSETKISDVRKKHQELSKDEAFAVLYGQTNDIDVIIDDPEKATLLASYGLHVIRLSDIISSVLTTP